MSEPTPTDLDLRFTRDGRDRVLISRLPLPRSLEELFPFFAEAENLREITPPQLGMTVMTPTPIEMRVGTQIDYKIKVRGVPMRWRSEITAWEPGVRFIDEQLKGPYKLWRHEHTFEDIPGGTVVVDEVRYRVPFDFLVHDLLIQPDLRRIFTYRARAMVERFGAMPARESATEAAA